MFAGTDDQVMAQVRQVRDSIREKVQDFVKAAQAATRNNRFSEP
jgi:hypothetical protein